MNNKYLGHSGGLIGPVPESVIESKPDFRDYDQGGQYHNAYTNWFNEHLSSLPVIPCEGWVPEIGREYTEGMDVSIKWHVKTQSYQGETDHYFDTEKEADKKYSEWSKWDGNLMALTSKPVKVAVQYVAIPLTPASPTEQADGGEVNCEIKIEDIDPRVIYNFLIEKGELEYAEHFNLIAKKAYQPPARVQEESEMQRLYDWLVDEQRKPAQTFFTSGELRNVAKEIEFRLSQQYPAEFVEWVGASYKRFHDKWAKLGEDPYTTKEPFFTLQELFQYWKNIQSQSK